MRLNEEQAQQEQMAVVVHDPHREAFLQHVESVLAEHATSIKETTDTLGLVAGFMQLAGIVVGASVSLKEYAFPAISTLTDQARLKAIQTAYERFSGSTDQGSINVLAEIPGGSGLLCSKLVNYAIYGEKCSYATGGYENYHFFTKIGDAFQLSTIPYQEILDLTTRCRAASNPSIIFDRMRSSSFSNFWSNGTLFSQTETGLYSPEFRPGILTTCGYNQTDWMGLLDQINSDHLDLLDDTNSALQSLSTNVSEMEAGVFATSMALVAGYLAYEIGKSIKTGKALHEGLTQLGSDKKSATAQSLIAGLISATPVMAVVLVSYFKSYLVTGAIFDDFKTNQNFTNQYDQDAKHNFNALTHSTVMMMAAIMSDLVGSYACYAYCHRALSKQEAEFKRKIEETFVAPGFIAPEQNRSTVIEMMEESLDGLRVEAAATQHEEVSGIQTTTNSRELDEKEREEILDERIALIGEAAKEQVSKTTHSIFSALSPETIISGAKNVASTVRGWCRKS